MKSQRITAIALAISLSVPALAEVPGNKVRYVGGTWQTKQQLPVGQLKLEDSAATFAPDKKKLGTISIPYAQVQRLSYTHTVTKGGKTPGWFGVGAVGIIAAASAATASSMLSKTHDRNLAIAWIDDKGVTQTATFEIGQDIQQATVFTLESRTGKKVEIQEVDTTKKPAKN